MPPVNETSHPRLPDLEAALRLFDETTAALSAQVQRLEGVLTQKQAELVETNRRLGEKVTELDHLTAWLNLVMGAVASGVVAVDTAGVITTCNEAAIAALGPMLPDPVGADYRRCFPDSPIGAVLDTGRPQPQYEHQVRLPDGTRRILVAKARPLRSPDGRLLGAVEVFEDVTEVRRLQEQVERADRLKQLGEMAAGVAHEIRNPLNGIEGFASLLVRDLPEDDRRRRYAEAVVSGVRDLNRTVSGLLEFTKPRRLDRRPADPVTLVRSCLDLLDAERCRDGSEGPVPELRLVDRWNGGELPLDSIQLRQVLLNLVQNATHAVIEAGTSPGVVCVTVERHADGVAIIVDDNGPGVPTAERQRIFTPFYTTREQGTGLGLAVAYTVVQLHGGALTVEDSPLGGARFRATVPG